MFSLQVLVTSHCEDSPQLSDSLAKTGKKKRRVYYFSHVQWLSAVKLLPVWRCTHVRSCTCWWRTVLTDCLMGVRGRQLHVRADEECSAVFSAAFKARCTDISNIHEMKVNPLETFGKPGFFCVWDAAISMVTLRYIFLYPSCSPPGRVHNIRQETLVLLTTRSVGHLEGPAQNFWREGRHLQN